MSPTVTVICAVWHRQKDKARLLEGHAASLRRQTLPPRVVYVFDAGDPPPAGLPGTAITVSDPLTIYQAWNIALGAVMTPLVMNLNVDDRLAPDAIEIMARATRRRCAGRRSRRGSSTCSTPAIRRRRGCQAPRSRCPTR